MQVLSAYRLNGILSIEHFTSNLNVPFSLVKSAWRCPSSLQAKNFRSPYTLQQMQVGPRAVLWRLLIHEVKYLILFPEHNMWSILIFLSVSISQLFSPTFI